MDEFDICPI